MRRVPEYIEYNSRPGSDYFRYSKLRKVSDHFKIISDFYYSRASRLLKGTYARISVKVIVQRRKMEA